MTGLMIPVSLEWSDIKVRSEIGKPEGTRASVLCCRMTHLSTRETPLPKHTFTTL